MKDDRWQKISRLYHAARELPEAARAAFLNACTDECLRREVSSLLENEERANTFFESPALDRAAEIEAKARPSLLGKQLGSYKLTSELGRGGMGEVYRAKDLKLGRDVAIKVLSEEFADDADRQARFQREAKLLASLNHPNIAAIHGLEESDGTQFLVLELVEGETLADKIARGPIPVEEALRLSLQIAEALEAAHEKGVIHRDLKPANIKITLDRKVKVLDFGLAKVFSSDQSDVDVSDSPTRSVTTTLKGIILGTAPYMSPEQAQGQRIDKRTDIWAFGCVFYEMLTGKAAFSGKNVTDIIAAVIRSDPEWSNLPANLHWRLKEVLERCLEKEARDRYHDIADVRADLHKVLEDRGGVLAQAPMAGTAWMGARNIVPWLATAIILTAILTGVAVWTLRIPKAPDIVRLDHELPVGLQFSNSENRFLAVSPDGKQIVYSTLDGLYRRSVNELDARLITGTEESPSDPFFSPDGQWVGYWSETKKQLKKISVDGGAPTLIAKAEIRPFAPIWGEDGNILFTQFKRGVMRVSADGGTPKPLFEPSNEIVAAAQTLPDGKTMLFTRVHTDMWIEALSLESGERKRLFEGALARYLPTGHLVYSVGNDLLAVAFDIDKIETVGSPVTILPGVYRSDLYHAAQFAISKSGTLVYAPATGGSKEASQRTFVWVDRTGIEEPISAPPKAYLGPRLSPDGSRVAFSLTEDGYEDIYLWDFVRENETRVTRDEAYDGGVLWTIDGNRLLFSKHREGEIHNGIYWQAADGSGTAEKLKSLPDRDIYPWSFSPDGKILALWEIPEEPNQDIAMMSMDGDRQRTPLLQEEAYLEIGPKISPDGKWMAYTSTQTFWDVYVCPFPDVDKFRRHIGVGIAPLWSPDGRKVYYLLPEEDTPVVHVMAATLRAEPTLEVEPSKELFRGSYVRPYTDDVYTWDIHPDGNRFLMMKEEESSADPRKIVIVLNWLEELERRVAAD